MLSRTAGGTCKTSSACPRRSSRAAARWLIDSRAAPAWSRSPTVGRSLNGFTIEEARSVTLSPSIPVPCPLELAVVGLVHRPHAALPQLAEDEVAPEVLRGLVRTLVG